MTRVAIIDDNKVNCFILIEYLNLRKVENISFTCSVEFAEYIKKVKTPPEIAIIDIVMPILDGYKIAEIVKNLHPQVKVIGITAMDNNNEVKNKCKECGMDYLLFKPYRQKELFRILDEIGEN